MTRRTQRGGIELSDAPRGGFMKELTDEAIDAYIAQARKLPSPLPPMPLYPIGGAVRRIGKNDTAWNTSDAAWSIVIAGIDSGPQQAGEITRWGEALLGGRASLLG
nr:hypothetical protein [Paraburkholderia sp. BL8N3]